jgi:acetyltransferase EpsM
MVEKSASNPRIFMFGASGHAKVIVDTLKSIGLVPIGLIDENPALKHVLDIPVYHTLESAGIKEDDCLIISVGDNATRKEIVARLNWSCFAKAIHPTAFISDPSALGEGTVVMANVSVNVDSIIGNHCIINTNCSVDHECVLQDYVHLSPNVALAGNVVVGEGAHIGIGAAVIQNIKIGKWATVGGGAVVIRDVPDYAVVVGNPARVIKYREQEQVLIEESNKIGIDHEQ